MMNADRPPKLMTTEIALIALGSRYTLPIVSTSDSTAMKIVDTYGV